MKIENQTHETLTLEEVQQFISDIYFIVHQEIEIENSRDKLVAMTYRLKRHFCPEKFIVMKVTVQELADMMEYPQEKDNGISKIIEVEKR